ncbi:unnamed protein product, partial [Prorocentrum cordatum]
QAAAARAPRRARGAPGAGGNGSGRRGGLRRPGRPGAGRGWRRRACPGRRCCPQRAGPGRLGPRPRRLRRHRGGGRGGRRRGPGRRPRRRRGAGEPAGPPRYEVGQLLELRCGEDRLVGALPSGARGRYRGWAHVRRADAGRAGAVAGEGGASCGPPRACERPPEGRALAGDCSPRPAGRSQEGRGGLGTGRALLWPATSAPRSRAPRNEK